VALASAAAFGARAYRLANVRAPLCLVETAGLAADAEGLTRLDLVIGDGRLRSIAPAASSLADDDLPVYDLDGGMVFPRFVDVHTHLDKGHIWPRQPNPDGTFAAALDAVRRDREAHWTADDIAARMEFSLQCALAHGTGAIRTHLDSQGTLTATSWGVFAAMREAWRDRIALQASALFPVELAVDKTEEFHAIVATVARHGGVLGGVTFLGEAPGAKLHQALDRLFAAASANGLDLDLHVDESGAPEARTLELIADAALRHRFSGRILAGHCCSLSLAADDDAARITAKLAEAGIAVVALPMCNMYLQDRRKGRTPRWRGIAPLHELKAAGVPVMVASDNTRDPFYAYGDLDMIEVLREATRILHLDHADSDWACAITTTPASVMALPGHGRIAVGAEADLVLTRARSWWELFARPQSDRMVVLAGRRIDTASPDYRLLDRLLIGKLARGHDPT
jgi:cytosine deaminase